MKTLLVLRHAKSSWDHTELADHDRPLNERGERDAPRMGRLLREQGLRPDAVLSSTAERAQRTAREVIEASGYAVEVDLTGDFYLAPPEAYLETLREQAEEHQCIMIVRHNPGLQDLVELLTGQPELFPTAALAHVELPVDRWQDLSTKTAGRLVHLWRPKELPD